MDIQQFVANGNTTEFSFSFTIAKGTLVNVYKTLVGNDVDETNDLLQNTDYNLAYTDDSADFTDGKITFNVAPANGDYITITPVLDGNTNIDFTAQNELSADNLNQALAKHTTPLNFSFELWKDRVTRYPINVKQDEISSYNTILPPLSDGGFWRRVGNTMFAQKYDDFVSEVTNSITTFNNDVEQVTISNQTGSTFSLSAFTSGDISQNTLDVFKNGLKLSITGDYTVDSTSNSITFVTALISTDTVYIIKPLIKESNTFMDTEGDNAIFTNNTKIADKSLTNTVFNTNTKVANKDMSNASLATETSQGVSRIATQSETNTGTVTNAFVTPATLRSILTSIVTPVGHVGFFYSRNAPANYLRIDGTHWSKTTYSELWSALQNEPEVSSDTNDFWINDNRGYVIRSTNDSIIGLDSTRTLGSVQDGTNINTNIYEQTVIEMENTDGDVQNNVNTLGSGQNSTPQTNGIKKRIRMANIAYNSYIKYTLGF